MREFWSPKGGHGPRRSLRGTRQLEVKVRQLCYHVLAICKQHNFQKSVLCEHRIAKTDILLACGQAFCFLERRRELG